MQRSSSSLGATTSRIAVFARSLVGLLPALLIIESAWSLVANAADGRVKCNPDGGQIEINVCAEEEFQKADREMNEVYQTVLHKDGADQTFAARLRDSQRAWLKFRDAELAATYACQEGRPQLCWGSMYPLCSANYMAMLTRERTKRLRLYLDEGRDYCP